MSYKGNGVIIAIIQMLWTLLIISLSKAQFGTLSLVFISLGFLAFYIEWQLILLTSLIGLIPFFMFENISGAVSGMCWIVLFDTVLILNIKMRQKIRHQVAKKELSLVQSIESIEQKSQKRTWELQESINVILEQQQSLIASAKMSTLGEMSAGIAHEINNPLTIIIAKISRLKRKIATDSLTQEEMLLELSQINETSNRIVKIIKGLKSFSRDGVNDPKEIFSVIDVVQDTLELCNERFRENTIDLRVDFNPLQEIKVEGSSVQISQVVFNLLSNAIDATKFMTDKWVEIKLEMKDSNCVLSITDCGLGIGPEIQQKLMQPFFTTKEKGLGTGLGLSISKVIIEKHNGRFYYDPNLKNTRFVIELPLT
jgi:C4-dicarboxylate-specific signal transduction histidine kinase